MNIKAILWRVVYAVILVIILIVIIPLLFELVGFTLPAGPAVTLLKFCFGCIVILYVLFGPEPKAPF